MKRAIFFLTLACHYSGLTADLYAQPHARQRQPRPQNKQPQKPTEEPRPTPTTSAGKSQPKPAQSWAKDLAASYFSGDELKKFSQRDSEGIALGTLAWYNALKPQFETIAQPADLMMFVPRYDPIWQHNSLNQPALKERLARIAWLNGAVVAVWQEALAKAHQDKVSELWTIGMLIDMPKLFSASGLNTAVSTVLLTRLSLLPPEAVETVSRAVNIGKARAAANLIQQDWLFNSVGFDTKKYAQAVDLLGKTLPTKPSN